MQFADTTLCFGCWHYSPEAGTLWRLDTPVPVLAQISDQFDPATALTIVLEPRLHALLNYFLLHPVVTHAKADLLDAVWGDADGSDAALMRAIAVLRKTLQDTAKPPTYLETLSKRGYRWIAPIEVLTPVVSAPVAVRINQSAANPATIAPVAMSAAPPWPAVQQALRIEKRRRLRLLSAFFICAVTALVISLLLFFGKTNFIPTFGQQVTISAMAGREQKPLLSADRQIVYYQQQTPDLQWRWVAHQLNNHQKQLQTQQFAQLGAASWFNGDLVFQAEQQGRCSLFRLKPSQFDRPLQPWLPCQHFMPQSLAAQDGEVVWLDQHPETGATQLWRFNGQKPELQQTFLAAYRRPIGALVSGKQVWVLLQQDDFNTSLYRFDLTVAVLHKVADFPYGFHSLARWDERRLLLSSSAGSFIFAAEQAQLIPLQLPSGAFVDQQRVGERLLATQVPKDAADLLPLQPASVGRSSTLLSASPWLSSNKTDQLLSWNMSQAVLVSERSGLPQIWWFDGENIRQLTRFGQWRQISQLLWVDTALHAVIDQQLFMVSLNDGSLTPAQFQDRQLRHFAVCHQQWYWTELSHQQWQLKTFNQQQLPIELLADSVDVRCAVDNSLLLLQLDGSIVQFWPDSAKRQRLTWQLDWRELGGNSWTTTREGLYWLDSVGQLWLSRWPLQQRELVPQLSLLKVSGLYGQLEQAQLFLQLAREAETDVVWLQPQQFQ